MDASMWDAEATAGRSARTAVERVDEITSLDTKIDNEALALALQSQVSFTSVECDELKVHDTVICTSYIRSEKHFFKRALPEKQAGTVREGESEIA